MLPELKDVTILLFGTKDGCDESIRGEGVALIAPCVDWYVDCKDVNCNVFVSFDKDGVEILIVNVGITVLIGCRENMSLLVITSVFWTHGSTIIVLT